MDNCNSLRSNCHETSSIPPSSKPCSNIQFIADDYIELNGHFTVDEGSEFQAIIGTGPTGEDWRYDYSITDHLGNTRVIFSDLNSSGTITDDEIIAEYQYYPFGLRMDGDWAENTSLHPVEFLTIIPQGK